MNSHKSAVTLAVTLVAALTLTACSASRIVASGSDDVARAAASAMRQQADKAARTAVVLGSAADEAAARQAVVVETAEAVRSSSWQMFKTRSAATFRVTRESEICQPVVDLLFAEDSDDIIDALYGLSDEASATAGAEELLSDLTTLIEIWGSYDGTRPERTYVGVATALFQDYYCAP
ncbi:hypothetical protein [Microbacterium lemovicicum]|nr:hypothetical protein [Microbacterium lemovicicum]